MIHFGSLEVMMFYHNFMLWTCLGSYAEASDQNFIDEEIEGEKASRMCSSKKMKTHISTASSHDQVICTIWFISIIITSRVYNIVWYLIVAVYISYALLGRSTPRQQTSPKRKLSRKVFFCGQIINLHQQFLDQERNCSFIF